MIHLLTATHIIVCVLLVLVVLLQQGKKDGMGAAFGGGSSSVFGARGAETFLEKFTKVLAVVFFCTSLGLVYFSSRESSNSLLSNDQATTPTTTESPTKPASAQPVPDTATQATPPVKK